MTPPSPDVLVLGSGPAGLAVAAACAGEGLDVLCVSPAPDAPWTNGYGAWLDELAAVEVEECVVASWPTALVHTGHGEHRLDRAYARVDNAALQARLHGRAEAAGARFLSGLAVQATHDDAGSRVTLEDGAVLRAALVVDATGHGPGLVARRGEGPAAFQVAWGRLLEVDDHPFEPGAMVLMDWRPADPASNGVPTFLYAMPMPDGRLFVEETSLAAAPPVPLALLRTRLDARLANLGIQVRREAEVERCRIPMDTPLPALPQRVVGFGGAAAMVHPASGYLLARVLEVAPRLARAVASGLDRDPEAAARAAWGAVWPAAERRTRALHALGLKLLLSLDATGTRAFFEAFFQLPERHWGPYLSASASPFAIAAAMSSLFLRLDASSRRRVVSLVVGAEGRLAVRDLARDLGGQR